MGNPFKDSQYLKRIKRAIEHDPGHPRHLGVKMQAHHLISAEGMKRSGLGHQVKKLGYNINYLPNLVFLPCTLQGACHMGIQPHRGNHDIMLDPDSYPDDIEPREYHEMVAIAIREMRHAITDACDGLSHGKAHDLVDKLDALSKNILFYIRVKPAFAPLTNIAMSFGKSQSGCAGVDSISKHKSAASCPVGRKHLYNPENPKASQGPMQEAEKILFKAEGYKFKVGK